MAKKSDNAPKVRFQVKKKVFVNGSLYDPNASKEPIYVTADPCLEGEALERMPEKASAAPASKAADADNDPPSGKDQKPPAA